jgi:hypothetical protein
VECEGAVDSAQEQVMHNAIAIGSLSIFCTPEPLLDFSILPTGCQMTLPGALMRSKTITMSQSLFFGTTARLQDWGSEEI